MIPERSPPAVGAGGVAARRGSDLDRAGRGRRHGGRTGRGGAEGPQQEVMQAAPADRNAVVVSVRRGPIGRARKGSLVDERPEDLAVSAVAAALDDVPQLPIGELTGFYLGCAVPEGAQNENPARRVAVLAGLDLLPAVTVNRFCASSV